MAQGGVGRWLRNKGFVYTDAQKLARWDDIGGPRGAERWALTDRWRYMASKVVVMLGVLVGILVVSLVLRPAPGVRGAMLLGAVIGMLLVPLPLTGYWWRRDRALYDRWLADRHRHPAHR